MSALNTLAYPLQSVGLDTTTIKQTPIFEPGEYFKYIYTSISCGNDIIIGEAIKKYEPKPPLIVYIDFLDNLEEMLKLHLEALGRKTADIVLFDAELDPESVGEAARNLEDKELSIYFGLKNPKSPQRIIEFEKQEGPTIRFIGMNICPTEFNSEVKKHCRISGMTILGFNSFGGYISAPRNIVAFTVPYLLSFAAAHCEVIMLSGRDLQKSWDNFKYLSTLIGKRHNELEFKLEKKIHKPVSTFNRIVQTSINIGRGFVIPYEDPEFITLDQRDTLFSINKRLLSWNKDYFISDDQVIYRELLDLLNSIDYPKSWYPELKFILARYKIQEYFKKKHPTAKIDYLQVGNTFLLIDYYREAEVKGHFLWQHVVKPEEKRKFFLAYFPGDSGDEGEIYFREMDQDEMEKGEPAEP